MMNSNPVLRRLETVFREQELPCPWVSPVLASQLAEYAPAMFASRPLTSGLYGLEPFVAEYLATPEPFVALGFDGHGLVSQAVHYYLADERVAVFVQQRWGTLFDDPAHDRECWAIMIKHTRKLLELAAERFPAGERLIVVQSSFDQPRFGWQRAGETGQPRWELCAAQGSPILAAAALRRRLQAAA